MSSPNVENLLTLIVDCAYQVHKTLGSGFLEKVYENALFIELLEHQHLKVEAQRSITVKYRSRIVGEYFADIVVDDCIVLELKALKSLLQEHSAQLINYLNAGGIKDGLLINFGSQKIEIKRLYGN